MTYIMLLAGLLLLVLSGELLVRGGASLAGHFRLSPMVVGLTVVSFGTSSPELVVSLDAAIKGYPDISLGNVVGSNISNLGLVLALTVIITPFFVNRKEIINDMIIMAGVSMVLFIMLIDLRFSRVEGLILVVMLVAYIYRSIRNDKKRQKGSPVVLRYSLPLSVTIVILSSLGLVVGANMLVKSASTVASALGISERIISVSVIAVGTSLPELSTSVIAGIRKENGISIGNVVGSNIFNILAVLGITASVKPYSINDLHFKSDMYWMIGIAILLIIMTLPSKNSRLSRWKGIFLALLYLSYLSLVFFVR
ncbi:MAG: calcium/sodium antiporter [Bacteroidota bacterium]|nr:calcium/sodium antiporter [Bacteroidota bacterium]